MTLQTDDPITARLRAADPAPRAVEPLPFISVLTRIDAEPARREPARRTRRRAPLVAAALVAVAAPLASVSLPLGSGPSIDVVSGARAAVSERGGLLHVVTVQENTLSSGPVTTVDARGDAVTIPAFRVRTERWSAGGAQREVISDLALSPERTVSEVAFDGRRLRRREGARVVEQTIDDATAATLRAAGSLGGGLGANGMLGADPQAAIRALLADGSLRDEGTGAEGRRRVRRLTAPELTVPMPFTAEGVAPTLTLRDVVYVVDAESFAPVRITVHVPGGPGAPVEQMTSVTTFETWERLPLDDAGAAQLRIDG